MHFKFIKWNDPSLNFKQIFQDISYSSIPSLLFSSLYIL